MKLAINADFTKFPKAVSVVAAPEAAGAVPFAVATLPHDERHLRRRAIGLGNGDRILVDLPKPVVLNDGDRLVLEDGRQVEIAAAEEDVYDIRARDPVHLAELAWHIGNRHLAAAIGAGRILILRDHVIRDMLEGLGATVTEIVERFQPVRGAYSGHDHGHAHHHEDDHDHHDDDHDHGHGRVAHRHHDDDADDEEHDHGTGRAARARSVASAPETPEPDHGHGRVAGMRQERTSMHDHDDDDHGAGRIARRKTTALPAEKAEPDHGAGRAVKKRAKPAKDAEPDHGAGRVARRKDK